MNETERTEAPTWRDSTSTPCASSSSTTASTCAEAVHSTGSVGDGHAPPVGDVIVTVGRARSASSVDGDQSEYTPDEPAVCPCISIVWPLV